MVVVCGVCVWCVCVLSLSHSRAGSILSHRSCTGHSRGRSGAGRGVEVGVGQAQEGRAFLPPIRFTTYRVFAKAPRPCVRVVNVAPLVCVIVAVQTAILLVHASTCARHCAVVFCTGRPKLQDKHCVNVLCVRLADGGSAFAASDQSKQPLAQLGT